MTTNTVQTIAQQSRAASRHLAYASESTRNLALAKMAEALESVRQQVLDVNAQEIVKARDDGQSEAMVKRLTIDDKTFNYMLSRLKKVAQLPDPLNRILTGHTNSARLRVYKKSVPLGVIGIIYESRPNVTTDAAGVCIKSGNAVILRGGSEALQTNTILTDAMIAGAVSAGLPEHAIQIIRTPGHEAVGELLKMDEYIDVLIPRGGKGLIKRIAEGTRIPVIKHYDGICHLYLAADADPEQAVALAVNSKCQSVQVCNALETLLVDSACAAQLLPLLQAAFAENGIELRGCEQTQKLLPGVTPAIEEDWHTEYLAPILSVKIVDGIQQAIDHINHYGSGHTDGIVTQSLSMARQFEEQVDSASVMINASTRLSGGGDYGLGSVVGISTDKLHVRGPVGPDELTTYKWVAYGDGHLRG
ncbi:MULTISPECIES: glutamate-5-semialdehyde dehydrogenase [Methylomonas]|uniref:Gamma-glutamyl phosphate reductase n=2 Tax=Methylomonas TaxID=416 RepID=A0A126T803_9GAMM|nr:MULTISPECIES: glutamate-5-semialdehyde dehydrogenase [Methylomonas]AMK77894.1 gamma-glutamyl-phosphate reductase [Methylomonas denitrificans]OAI04553.1 gamma-glutamyl-phosphate reductase [Methylomonas methanica]TCV87067.1 glutamate-5-semialdehyde dehydrogenase [Methylomonas methanica]